LRAKNCRTCRQSGARGGEEIASRKLSSHDAQILARIKNADARMTVLRHLIVAVLLLAFAALPAHAQRLKINYVVPPDDRPAVAARMHPAAKGAVIGGIAGAGFWGGVGVWYCTIGPNEVGECDNPGQWARGTLLWGRLARVWVR
jgi:hypothetical protein